MASPARCQNITVTTPGRYAVDIEGECNDSIQPRGQAAIVYKHSSASLVTSTKSHLSVGSSKRQKPSAW
eukprot:6219409-Pyramimonas_sp.AAC.1